MTQRLEDAVMLLDLVSSYDARYRGLDQDALVSTTQAWALQLDATNLTLDELTEGARRAYAAPERPVNPVGAILTEARTARSIARKGHVAALTRATPKPACGDVLESAYRNRGALDLACPTCQAEPGQWCTEAGKGPKRIPHTKRLRNAYAHSPEGKQRRQERQAHLAKWRADHGPEARPNPRQKGVGTDEHGETDREPTPHTPTPQTGTGGPF